MRNDHRMNSLTVYYFPIKLHLSLSASLPLQLSFYNTFAQNSVSASVDPMCDPLIHYDDAIPSQFSAKSFYLVWSFGDVVWSVYYFSSRSHLVDENYYILSWKSQRQINRFNLSIMIPFNGKINKKKFYYFWMSNFVFIYFFRFIRFRWLFIQFRMCIGLA